MVKPTSSATSVLIKRRDQPALHYALAEHRATHRSSDMPSDSITKTTTLLFLCHGLRYTSMTELSTGPCYKKRCDILYRHVPQRCLGPWYHSLACTARPPDQILFVESAHTKLMPSPTTSCLSRPPCPCKLPASWSMPGERAQTPNFRSRT